MTRFEKDTLARIHRDCAQHIRRADDSNLESAEHVRQSKTAIARSLDLLRRSYFSR